MLVSDVNETEGLRYPATYAALSKFSRGRRQPLPQSPYRTAFQRDRDRIIHSSAFRRLQHKTQVFANFGEEKDHYRTRLTHTIEVAQISRTVARLLGLNEDLAEAVALAHDLGHTPFGHAGENVLNELLTEFGGFNHNVQSLRVVDYLETRYPGYYGLNLTYELREAIIKHESEGSAIFVPDEFSPEEQALLEGQLVNLADEIAYNGHDVDDGLSSGLLTLEQLRGADFLGDLVRRTVDGLEDPSPEMTRKALVRHLVNQMVLDLAHETSTRLERHKIDSVDDVRHASGRLVAFSETQKHFNEKIKFFLRENMYQHPRLEAMHRNCCEIMAYLFDHYRYRPESVPQEFRNRYPDQPAWRWAADYTAGMTDRYAFAEFNRLRMLKP